MHAQHIERRTKLIVTREDQRNSHRPLCRRRPHELKFLRSRLGGLYCKKRPCQLPRSRPCLSTGGECSTSSLNIKKSIRSFGDHKIDLIISRLDLPSLRAVDILLRQLFRHSRRNDLALIINRRTGRAGECHVVHADRGARHIRQITERILTLGVRHSRRRSPSRLRIKQHAHPFQRLAIQRHHSFDLCRLRSSTPATTT